jgi:medium-chain acyl-[acyl-carrier-protein] hydrolase
MFSDWLIPLRNNKDSKINLLCFHHAGGTALFFRKIIHYIIPHINIYAIQLPGRDNRYLEERLNRFDQVMINLRQYVVPLLNNDHHLIIFGHSLGALIGYEFSKLLYQSNFSFIKHLIVSGRNPPSLSNREKFILLDNDSLLKYLQDFGDIPPAIWQNRNILDIYLPIIRSDFQIINSYNYQGPSNLPFAISAFVGNSDKTLELESIGSWALESNIDFNQIMFEGGHFYINDNLKEVCKHINHIIMEYIVS